MNRLVAYAVPALLLLASAGSWAHDPKLHKGNAITGEIASVAAGSFELKTRTGTLKVTFSSKTKFEHGTATVDASHLKKGERAGVIGTKLATGELVAKEVLLGVPEEKPAAKTAAKKAGGHKQ